MGLPCNIRQSLGMRVCYFVVVDVRRRGIKSATEWRCTPGLLVGGHPIKLEMGNTKSTGLSLL